LNQQVSGRIGPTGARVQCHAVVERRQEVVIVYGHMVTIILVWDLRRKFTDVLVINAQVSYTLCKLPNVSSAAI